MQASNEGISALLAEVAALDGVKGAALVTRDGLPHEFLIPGSVNDEVFAAMSATLMGAAETALFELGGQEPQRILVETGTLGFMVAPAGRDLLIVVAMLDLKNAAEVFARVKTRLASLSG